MFFIILSTLFLITPPQPDSTLANQCQEKFIDSTATAVFQTLHSSYLAAEEFKNQNPNEKYPTFSIFYDKHISIQEFQDTLKFILPVSEISRSSFRVGISIIEYDEDCPYILVISFFNSASENHLPIANFRYCVVDSSRSYEFINYDKNVKLTIEEIR